MALATLRSLYTFIKNKDPNNSTHREIYLRFKDTVPVERYDKLIENVTTKIKAKSMKKFKEMYKK
jgi:hypothetical protein